MSNKTYEDAVRILNSVPNNAASRMRAETTNMETRRAAFREMYDLLDQIGYLPSDFNRLNIIHIAGSKGKGSTAAITAATLSRFLLPGHAPTTIGVYTSPHLRTIRDRILLIRKPMLETPSNTMSEELFAKYFFEVWERLQRHGQGFENLSFFRVLTLVALHAFMEEGVDTAIVECGIGGEVDATNVIERPTVNGITSLELEHTELLGNTLQSIAWHKSGIMRPGVPTFTVNQKEEALQELRRRAVERETTLDVVQPCQALQIGGQRVSVDSFHALNAGLAQDLALAQLRVLESPALSDPELRVKMHEAIHKLSLPGRFEIRNSESCRYFIDGAHTLQSLAKTTEWFLQHTAKRETKARILLFNQEGRDTLPLLSQLHGSLQGQQPPDVRLTHIIFCGNSPFVSGTFGLEAQSINGKLASGTNTTRQAMNVAIWEELAGPQASETVFSFPTIREAVEHITTDIVRDGVEVDCLVTGSMHLIGGFEIVLDKVLETAALKSVQ